MNQLLCLILLVEKTVLRTIEDLNKNNGMTIILITHFMEEAVDADRIMLLWMMVKSLMEGSPTASI
jgi:energy-coupling factor transport system ATP-binding protein